MGRLAQWFQPSEPNFFNVFFSKAVMSLVTPALGRQGGGPMVRNAMSKNKVVLLVVQAFSPSTTRAEAGRSLYVWGQPELLSETLKHKTRWLEK